ncbi:hypothetical protein ATZ33_17300 [Enterococcus silesiacus]|uniref:Uncharacterized protein n=1 Tax=Enterococcus silesiacus TaxID=332949 RepID=A0ABN4JB46_9ENTE|nr:hypothetical protein [Enterococcus silesiacus]ALS03070.1 hypothetical protein ATZ33_17300 [Enterococcus silesiacus]
MNPATVINYTCRLQIRKCDIGIKAIDGHRPISEAEKSEIAWINAKMKIINELIMKGWYEK